MCNNQGLPPPPDGRGPRTILPSQQLPSHNRTRKPKTPEMPFHSGGTFKETGGILKAEQTPQLILQERGSVKWPNRSLEVSRSNPGLERSHTQVTAFCRRSSQAQEFPPSSDSDALVFEIDVETWDHRKMGKNKTMIFLFDKVYRVSIRVWRNRQAGKSINFCKLRTT